MAIKLMAAAWEIAIPSTEKLVLLCLCDFANDHGVCWPSIKTIATKCSMSERTVQGTIKKLRDDGFCSWNDAPGKPHQFRLDPRKICTPAESAPPQILSKPPQNLHPTPAAAAPKPSMNHQEPPKSIIPRPDGVSEQVWMDFLRHRRRKGDDLTQTALNRIVNEAAKANWPLEEALAELVTRGWKSFKADWVKDGNRNGQRTERQGTRAIGERVAARLADAH